MSSARTLVERTDEAPARRERPVIGRAIALVLRLLVAAVLSLALCRLIWQFVPDTLSDPKGVLGYPIFANFDITRYYDAFYVLAIAFPLGAIVAYHVLGRLRRRRRGGRAPLFPVGLDTPGTAAAGTEPRARAVLAWAVVRASLPALVVALEVSVVSSPRARDVSAGGIVAGAAYLVVVVVLGLLLLRLQARPGAARQGPAWSARALATTMSAVDSILGVTTVFLLYGVSLRTSIAVGTAPRVVHYPWFPLWLAVVASLALGWWTVGALRRRTGHAAIVGVEARTLTIVGAIAIFMTTASLPGALGGFSGFDDAQFLAGPQLVFVHGLTPWSQFVPFHGLLFDVFGSVVGMVVFGNTRWGAVAGQSLFLLPATWLALYVMAVHFLKRWRMFVAAFTLAVVLGVFGGFVDYRWLFLPYLFVALDKVLRTASRGWTILFTVGVIAQAVLVPEGDLITVSVLVVVALFELATRRRGAPLRSSFARTRWCIATALVVGACFAAYLAATGSLGAFIDYYRTIISVGNGLEGGQPIGHRGLVLSFGGHSSVRFTVELLLPGVLVVMTAWLVTAKLRARMAFTTTEWVMVAAALGVLGYYPEALARLDTGHVAQMFSVAIPLVVLWGAELLHLLDTARTRSRPRAPAGGPRPLPARLVLLPGLAVATMTAVVVWAPASLGTTLDTAPSHFHARAPAEPPALLPALGYTIPGSVDTAQIESLAHVLDTYAGPSGPVYAFDNDVGVPYYLLNRVPGTRFDNELDGYSPYSQSLLVGDLERSRPRLVIYTNGTFGLPSVDSYRGVPISDALHSYAVSQYILDHYRPLVSVQGQLVLLRDDLVGKVPPLPPLSVPARTSDLYEVAGTCAWGYSPNFLPPPSQGAASSVALSVSHGASTQRRQVVKGWAVDPATLEPATSVVAVRHGQVVARAVPALDRPDVAKALHAVSSATSGFVLVVPDGAAPFDVLAVNPDGTATRIGGSGAAPAGPPPSVVPAGGGAVRVVEGADVGHVDSIATTSGRFWTVREPPGKSLSSFRWLTVTFTGDARGTSFALTDLVGDRSHEITWWGLPQSGHRMSVQVGSCPQWHGFGQGPLDLEMSGGGSITSVTLSP